MGSVKNFHHPGDLDPYPANNALNSYTLIREEPGIIRRIGADLPFSFSGLW